MQVLGRELTPVETARFSKYLELLVKWQRVHRLIGSDDRGWIVSHLLLDSLLFLVALEGPVGALLDLGAGGGLPGIPLRIVSPEMHLTMIEARQRRASFLSTAVREIGLESARVIGKRAEDAVEELGASFDAVVMRCAGAPGDLIPLARRFLRKGGRVVASGSPEAEPGGDFRVVRVRGVVGESRTFLVAEG